MVPSAAVTQAEDPRLPVDVTHSRFHGNRSPAPLGHSGDETSETRRGSR